MRVDVDLIHRLERAYGAAAAQYANRRAHEEPACGARVLTPRPGIVIVDSGRGGGENAHRAYGLGHAAPLDVRAWDEELAEVERFYAERPGAAVHVSTTPPVPAVLYSALAARGYVVTKQSSVLVRELPAPSEPREPREPHEPREHQGGKHVIRILADRDVDAMLDVIDACYGESDRAASRARSLPLFRAPTAMFGAFVGDALVAVAALVVVREAPDVRDVGLLFAGMCRPERRGQGLQAALIEARLVHARAMGLTLLTSLTEPASSSERNLRRAGFTLACTQSVWSRA